MQMASAYQHSFGAAPYIKSAVDIVPPILFTGLHVPLTAHELLVRAPSRY